MKPSVVLLVFALPLTAVSGASADPVTITSGFLLTEGWNVVSRPSTVSGTDGFHMTTTLAIGAGSGRIDPIGFCMGESECAPGRQGV